MTMTSLSGRRIQLNSTQREGRNGKKGTGNLNRRRRRLRTTRFRVCPRFVDAVDRIAGFTLSTTTPSLPIKN